MKRLRRARQRGQEVHPRSGLHAVLVRPCRTPRLHAQRRRPPLAAPRPQGRRCLRQGRHGPLPRRLRVLCIRVPSLISDFLALVSNKSVIASPLPLCMIHLKIKNLHIICIPLTSFNKTLPGNVQSFPLSLQPETKLMQRWRICRANMARKYRFQK